jgi:hypothetical protein
VDVPTQGFGAEGKRKTSLALVDSGVLGKLVSVPPAGYLPLAHVWALASFSRLPMLLPTTGGTVVNNPPSWLGV